jgi:hypothetical protein
MFGGGSQIAAYPSTYSSKHEWDPFKPYLRTFTNKDLKILHGPICSLSEMARKKSKRKSITLVRRVD